MCQQCLSYEHSHRRRLLGSGPSVAGRKEPRVVIAGGTAPTRSSRWSAHRLALGAHLHRWREGDKKGAADVVGTRSQSDPIRHARSAINAGRVPPLKVEKARCGLTTVPGFDFCFVYGEKFLARMERSLCVGHPSPFGCIINITDRVSDKICQIAARVMRRSAISSGCHSRQLEEFRYRIEWS